MPYVPTPTPLFTREDIHQVFDPSQLPLLDPTREQEPSPTLDTPDLDQPFDSGDWTDKQDHSILVRAMREEEDPDFSPDQAPSLYESSPEFTRLENATSEAPICLPRLTAKQKKAFLAKQPDPVQTLVD